jgi:glycosyltransferase involved in cell wall biosynthesis
MRRQWATARACALDPMEAASAPRRLCLLIYGLTGGGVPRLTVTLAEQFLRRGWQVDLAVIDARRKQERPALDGLRHIEINGWLGRFSWVRAKRKRQYQLARWGFARYLRRCKPDAVIAADVSVCLAALQARTWSGWPGPLILSVHNSLDYLDRKKPAMAAGVRANFPSADALVAVSSGIARQLVAMGVARARVHVLPNPVITADFDALSSAAAPCFDFSAGRPTVIGVGRLVEQKDFSTLLRAFGVFQARHDRARLLLLGDGEERESLQALAASLGIADAVCFAGAVPSALPYIARADLLVLSSIREGMPSVLIEALACGTPVVSTNCETGPADILEEGRYGTLVAPGDWQALGEAMIRGLQASLPGELLRERGRAYTAERSADAYCALLDAVCATRASRSQSLRA